MGFGNRAPRSPGLKTGRFLLTPWTKRKSLCSEARISYRFQTKMEACGQSGMYRRGVAFDDTAYEMHVTRRWWFAADNAFATVGIR